MQYRKLGRTGLEVPPIVFGGNVFGWTADEATSFALLDAMVDAGLNTIDTADVYSAWFPGNAGGESETTIGRWLAARPGAREKVLILTKAGGGFGPNAPRKGLSARWIEQAVEDSLRRLQTDVIDLYQAHWPDPATPYEETLRAFEKLMAAGKVRAIGASNLDAGQLAESLEVARTAGVHRYDTLQPEYNLYTRDTFEGPLQDLVIKEEIATITYYSLASGFLSGKYRSTADLGQSDRGSRIGQYLNPRGDRILKALDDVATRNGATAAEAALAWLIAQPGVTAPIASATSLTQLASLVKAATLRLPAEDLTLLTDAGA